MHMAIAMHMERIIISLRFLVISPYPENNTGSVE